MATKSKNGNPTLLSASQLSGDGKLEVFKKRGIQAKCSAFANSVRYCFDDNKGGSNDSYWTKTPTSSNNKLLMVKGNDICIKGAYVDQRSVGIRLCIQADSLEEILSKVENVRRASDGVLECDYGHLPKEILNPSDTERLNNLKNEKALEKTKFHYSTDSELSDYGAKIKSNNAYQDGNDGKIYIKYEAASLNNGSYWSEVRPVRWWIDEKANALVSEDIVYNGLLLKKERESFSDYDNIFLNKFIQKCLAPELVQMLDKEKIIGYEKPGILLTDVSELFHNIFHRKDKVKALPKGRIDIESNKIETMQETGAELTEEKQADTNEFKERIRREARINETEMEPLRADDGEIYPQRQYSGQDNIEEESVKIWRPRKEIGDDVRIWQPRNEEEYKSDLSKAKEEYKVDLSKPDYVPPSKPQEEPKMDVSKIEYNRPKVSLKKPPYQPKKVDVDDDFDR